MQTTSRTLFVASYLALVAVAGGGGGNPAGPTTPSAVAGATIVGTVNGASAVASAGLTITVVGTNLPAVVENAGRFQIAGVPPGNVQLLFRNATVNR